MDLRADIKPVSYLKSHTADILKQLNECRRPVVITQNGEPRAVMQDPESYDNLRRAIGLLKLLSQSEEELRQGAGRKQNEVFADLEKLLGDKGL